ncbi:MAG: PP0621 family protein [Rugosibacter sp.]
MIKIILFVLLVGYLVFRLGKKQRKQTREAPQPLPEAMVRCAHCGIYVPQSEAVVDLPAQRAYCSAAHRALGAK